MMVKLTPGLKTWNKLLFYDLKMTPGCIYNQAGFNLHTWISALDYISWTVIKSKQVIDRTWCQFHQRFLRVFFVRTSSSLVTWKLPKLHLYEEFVRIMLMKLTTGIQPTIDFHFSFYECFCFFQFFFFFNEDFYFNFIFYLF